MSCIFCDIAAGKIPATIIHQDEYIVAFNDLHPVAPVHKLIIPRQHIATLNEAELADSETLGRLMQTAAKLAKNLNLSEEGYRVVMNCNAAAGQTVFHIHLHLLGGRNFSWPPG